MRRTTLLTTAAAAAVGTAMLVSLTPGEGSDARWRTSETAPVSGPSSDVFGLTAADLPDPLPASQMWPTGTRVNNTPGFDLTNGSARHSSWLNVKSTRLTNAVAGDTNNLIANIALDYTYGSTTCASGTTAYWTARGVGQIAAGTTYPRSETKVAGATLTPGQKRVVCPLVKPGYATGTTAGNESFLLNHAGRAVDITTVVNQRSEAPATWASQDRTITSRYRVAAPPPVKQATWTNDVCMRTGPAGSPSSVGSYGGFYWHWPSAAGASPHGTPTPAMAGGWELMRLSRDGTRWESWKTITASGRDLVAINSNDINSDGAAASTRRKFVLRGYPFAGDKTRYVESQWVAEAWEEWDSWRCGTTSYDNPNAGPHNMP